MPRRHIPNVLSISRIGMSVAVLPLAARFDRGTFLFTIGVIATAFASDWADGFLARRWSVCSDLGYVLDAMGDRAIHLALSLIILVRYHIAPLYIWLLIFRDILIYAVRIMSHDWLRRSRHIQWLSRLHATLLRTWLCSYFVREGILLYLDSDLLNSVSFQMSQLLLLCTTITLSYWGIARSILWVIESEAYSCSAFVPQSSNRSRSHD